MKKRIKKHALQIDQLLSKGPAFLQRLIIMCVDLFYTINRLSKSIKPTTVAFLHDCFMMGISCLLTLALLRGPDLALISPIIILRYIAVYTLIAAAVFIWVGPYRHVWKYASFNDVTRIVLSILYSNAIFVPLQIKILTLPQYSLPILIVTIIMSFAMITIPRLIYLLATKKTWRQWLLTKRSSPLLRALIIGAGDQAELFIRQSKINDKKIYEIVGIIDDDQNKLGQFINNVEVIGRFYDLARILNTFQKRNRPIDVIIVADMNLYGPAVRPLHEITDHFEVQVMRLANFNEMTIAFNKNDQSMNPFLDIFESKPFKTDYDKPALRKIVSGKRIAILGAQTSFTEALIHNISDLGPVHLSIHSDDENRLSSLEHFFVQHHPFLSRQYYLRGFETKQSCKDFFANENPEVVILCPLTTSSSIAELSPAACLHKALGPLTNLMSALEYSQVKKIVLLSSTFVNTPHSTYGKIMKLIEHVFINATTNASKDMELCAGIIRFPSFIEAPDNILRQIIGCIQNKTNIILPGPDMQRYFITESQATNLVMNTLSCIGTQTYIFAPNFPKHESITNLAYRMIQRLGPLHEQSVEVEFSNQEFGEPLQENLVGPQEQTIASPLQSLITTIPHPLHINTLHKILQASLKSSKNNDDFDVQKALNQL